MNELRYERITVDRAEELAAIEHAVFTTIDAEDLYDADGVAKLAAKKGEGEEKEPEETEEQKAERL